MATSTLPPAKTLLDLPSHVLGQRIVAHPELDAASRLALFRTSHALARMVLQHAPGTKRLTVGSQMDAFSSSRRWSKALLRLLGRKKQRLRLPPADLELKVTSSLLRRPPAAISHHVSHLHLHQCTLTGRDVAVACLHDATLWPHLRHLTIHNCSYEGSTATTATLQPAPHLHTFTWRSGRIRQDGGLLDVLCLLAAKATHAHLELSAGACVEVLQRLQQLTHCHVQRLGQYSLLQALLNHPALEHVSVGSADADSDSSKQLCRWKSLTLPNGADISDLGRLPLASLERLSVARCLDAYTAVTEGQALCLAAGVALLQQLHSRGRLQLLPYPGDDPLLGHWQLQRSSCGLFNFRYTTPSTVVPLLRLVVAAGQGINTLVLDEGAVTLMQMREEVAPLLQHSGRVHTLCLNLTGSEDEAWCAGFLGVLPPCITHVKVDVWVLYVPHVKALLASVKHPLRLTLFHSGQVSGMLEAELLRLVAGGSAGGGCAAGVPLLTLDVVLKQHVVPFARVLVS